MAQVKQTSRKTYRGGSDNGLLDLSVPGTGKKGPPKPAMKNSPNSDVSIEVMESFTFRSPRIPYKGDDDGPTVYSPDW